MPQWAHHRGICHVLRLHLHLSTRLAAPQRSKIKGPKWRCRGHSCLVLQSPLASEVSTKPSMKYWRSLHARESKHMPVWDPSMRNDPLLLHVICLQYHCPALTLIRRSTACSADMCLPRLTTHISIHLPVTELPSLHSLWICREAQDEECAERASAAVHTSKAVKENRHLASRSCLHESMILKNTCTVTTLRIFVSDQHCLDGIQIPANLLPAIPVLDLQTMHVLLVLLSA